MLDTMYDISSEQILDFTTRGNKTLDLFITNRPLLIESSNALPRLSDHDMILVQARTIAARTKAPQRKILLWKRADQTIIRSAVQDFTNSFIQDHSATSAIDNMWTDFTSAISQIIETTVPSKGTVLGPLLFLLYINDLPRCVTSTSRLFDDDSLIYRKIKSEADALGLQEDLDRLQG
jgi:hypothetical protein